MLRSISRFFVIWHTLIKYGIDQLIPKTSFHFLVKIVTYTMPISWVRKLDEPIEIRIRKTLELLGPIYVKFGQALSTRPDLLSPEMATELTKLQDNVPPFPTHQAISIIEKNLKRSINELFAQFDDKVLASASIAQVHSATLHSGEQVIVKVVRPDITKTILNDLSLMALFAQCIHFLSSETKRLRLPEIVKEFDKTINDELDLMQEAANASTLRENFIHSDILYIPKIYWDYCAKSVLVMERVFAVSIGDIGTLKAHNVNLKELAKRGVTIFFTQVFYHQYFHADMHPGNIFVDISDPEKPKYIGIDFGIMGSLNDEDQYYLAENFLAFFNRDYRRVAQLHIDSGWIPSTVKVTDFESAIRKASEPIFGKPLKEISFGQFLLTLFQTARRYEMEVQPQLVLLQKTFFNIEGLGRVLYPNLDLWETGKPILENWMKDQFSPIGFYKKLKSHTGEYTEILSELPMLIEHHLKADKTTKEAPHNSRLVEGVLLGFIILIVCQPTLFGGSVTRYTLSSVALILLWRIFRK
ncbi:MAG: ubiquinone biosynthesis regulatory protein kinase UbiB [Ostreibacterium sp.]